MRKIIAIGVIMVVLGLVCPMAYGEGPNKTDSDEWQFSITPYLWAVGLNGDMTVKGMDSEVDENFGDILSNLDIALEAHFEVWKDKWGGFFDGTYVKLKTDAGTTGNIDIRIHTLDGHVTVQPYRPQVRGYAELPFVGFGWIRFGSFAVSHWANQSDHQHSDTHCKYSSHFSPPHFFTDLQTKLRLNRYPIEKRALGFDPGIGLTTMDSF